MLQCMSLEAMQYDKFMTTWTSTYSSLETKAQGKASFHHSLHMLASPRSAPGCCRCPEHTQSLPFPPPTSRRVVAWTTSSSPAMLVIYGRRNGRVHIRVYCRPCHTRTRASRFPHSHTASTIAHCGTHTHTRSSRQAAFRSKRHIRLHSVSSLLCAASFPSEKVSSVVSGAFTVFVRSIEFAPLVQAVIFLV